MLGGSHLPPAHGTKSRDRVDDQFHPPANALVPRLGKEDAGPNQLLGLVCGEDGARNPVLCVIKEESHSHPAQHEVLQDLGTRIPS